MADESIRDYQQTIALNVRALREKRGFTQGQLCMATGMAQTTVSRIENHGQPMTLNTLYLLAYALKCKARDIIPDTSQDVVDTILAKREALA